MFVMNSPYEESRSREPFSSDLVRIPVGKRALDIALILVALPLLFPLMLFIAVLIRVVSSGPVLFRQERVGYLGRRFMCFKFRTMFVGVDTTVHQGYLSRLMNSDLPLVKIDAQGDPRLIPFGLLLRSSGLDELPQIFNVLRGEMSLVGPRPCLPYEYDDYLPWQRERFDAVPGLTGLWQVSGKNRTTFVEMVRLDITYARNRNLGLDCKIILKTIPALIGQMLDTREKRKSFSRADQPERVIPVGGVRQRYLSEAAFATISHPYKQKRLNVEESVQDSGVVT
jgi:lipopolysaccharide/colanic/teichoic acid biosynthesis glycosyltransferase